MSNEHLYRINVWFYSCFLKLIPCIVLTLVTALLVRAMIQAVKRAQRLRDMGNRSEKRVLIHGDGKRAYSRQKKTDRTTRLLIAILFLFLLTEFPQGVLGFLAAVLDESFFFDCYTPLGELMDMMALVNCTINFVLYCLMSRLFRTTGRKLLRLPAQNSIERPQPSRFTFGLTAVGTLQKRTAELGTTDPGEKF